MLAAGQKVKQALAQVLALAFGRGLAPQVVELVGVGAQVPELFGQVQPVDVAVRGGADGKRA